MGFSKPSGSSGSSGAPAYGYINGKWTSLAKPKPAGGGGKKGGGAVVTGRGEDKGRNLRPGGGKGGKPGRHGPAPSVEDAVNKAANAGTPYADLPPPTNPLSPQTLGGGSYNPFTSAFQQFRMAPYMLNIRTQLGGRPSLVRGRQ